MVFGLILLMSRAHTLFMCYLFCLLGLILVNFASGPRHFIGIYAILCEVVTIGVSRFIEHSKIVQRVRLFPFVRTGLLPPAILLLIMIPTVTILPTLWNIRSQDYYCYYPTIWTYVKSSLPIDGVAATQSPQLTFATTGYSAVGGTWLHRYINLIRRKFYPDVILIVADASRKHFSYARRRVGKLSSYRFAMSCHVEGTDFRFLILSRKGLVNTHPGQCRVLK